jgi:tRNA A-37 threonylcarbamoyl transferase component Bud32
MATRKRCSECRCTFTPSPRALATQMVCGAPCRAARDRRLARQRRSGDIDGYRADERRRQQACRAARAARAEAHGVEPPGDCHAVASVAKPSEVQEEIAKIVDRAVEASRATLLRDLGREWPRLHEILVTGGDVSRASFPLQVPVLPRGSGEDMDPCHA